MLAAAPNHCCAHAITSQDQLFRWRWRGPICGVRQSRELSRSTSGVAASFSCEASVGFAVSGHVAWNNRQCGSSGGRKRQCNGSFAEPLRNFSTGVSWMLPIGIGLVIALLRGAARFDVPSPRA
jgi:hypothetical protein